MNRSQVATRYVLGLLIVAVPILFVPIGPNPFEPPKAIMVRLAAALLLAIGISELSFKFRLPLLMPNLSWVSLPALGTTYILVAILSTTLAYDFRLSLWGSQYDYHGLITLISSFVIGLYLSKNLLSFRSVAVLLTFGSVPVVFYGLVQAIGSDPIVWQTDSLSPILSTLGRSNFVAAYLAILLPFCFYLVLQKPRAWSLWIIFGLQIVCLLLTQARAGWLAAMLGLGLISLGINRQNLIQKGVILGLIGVASLMAVSSLQEWRRGVAEEPAGWHSYDELRSISIEQRFLIWEKAVPIARQAGLLGYGPEQFTQLFVEESAEISEVAGREIIVNDPHNLVIDQIISYGWLGLVLFLVLIGRFFLLGWHDNRLESLVLMSAMGAFLVQGFFTPDVVVTLLLFWMLIGGMAGLQNQKVNNRPDTLESQIGSIAPPINWRVWEKLTSSQMVLVGCAILFLGAGFFMRTYQVGEWLRFTGDEARDTLAAYEIATGRYFHSKGPKIGAGFGSLGPAFYYLMAVPLRLAQGEPAVFGWFIALVDFASIGMLFVLIRRVFNQRIGLITAGLYAVSFQIVFYARWGWHPSLVPFFIFLIMWGCLEVAEEKPGWIPILLLTFSIALQLHLTVILFVVPITIALWYGRHALMIPISAFGLLVLIYPFVPLLVYEINNGYPNLLGSQYLYADQNASPWISPTGYLINSLTTISTTQIVHKSITLLPGRFAVDVLNIGLFMAGVWAFTRKQLARSTWLLLLSWIVVPIVAMVVFRGFRPDYYLITWFAIPLVFAALALDWMWQRWQLKGVAIVVTCAIVAINLAAAVSHFRLLDQPGEAFWFYYGSTLSRKQELVDLLVGDVADTHYDLALVSWSWPNHQPYGYLLMDEENPPRQMWMFESADVDRGPFVSHWIDGRRFNVVAVEDQPAEMIYIIKEPDTLPFPPELKNAEKVGVVGRTGLYKLPLDR